MEERKKEGKGPGFGGRLLSGLFATVGSVPLRGLYVLSDVVAFLAYRVVGYRRRVVHDNLTSCFPEKDAREIREIEKEFYRFLGDYFVETLRLGVMSEEEIRLRMRFENAGEVNEVLENGGNVTLYLGHYCNWEWLSSIPLHTPPNACTGQIYHPLRSKASDYAFLKIRSHFGATSIKMADTLKTLLRWRKEGRPSITGYIADQTPKYNGIHYFADFLHHETAAYTGPERLSRMLHAAVFYCDIRRPRRGEYVCRYVKMADDAATLPQFELTRKYYGLLEGSIRRQPPYWLWSHRRWKRTREDFLREYGPEEARKLLSHL